MITEIVVIGALILANGLFAMSEMALVSARKSRLKAAADAGDPRARTALSLVDSPTRFLSTVQIGISVIATLTAAFGGASISEPLASALRHFPPLAAHAYTIALGLVVVTISYFSLVFGELVPKRIALGAAESIAIAMADPMMKLSRLVSPIVHLLSFSSEGVLRLLGWTRPESSTVSQEDLRFLIDLSSQTGNLPESEREILGRVFQLGDRRAWAVMKPRPEIVWLDIEDPAEKNWEKILSSGYSRYPVCRSDLDTLLGITSLKTLLKMARAGELKLTEKLDQPIIVPESKPALEILDLFKSRAIHMAMVIDEFGSIQGVITLGDILESLVGYTVPIDQAAEREAIQREDGSWLFDGTLPIDELKQYLELRSSLPDEQAGYYQTLAGFVMTQLGRIPSAGDHFVWGGLRFEVLDMDGHRIDKIWVAPESQPKQ
jgi:putative hemolysin